MSISMTLCLKLNNPHVIARVNRAVFEEARSNPFISLLYVLEFIGILPSSTAVF